MNIMIRFIALTITTLIIAVSCSGNILDNEKADPGIVGLICYRDMYQYYTDCQSGTLAATECSSIYNECIITCTLSKIEYGCAF